MRQIADRYYTDLIKFIHSMRAADRTGKQLGLSEGIEQAALLIRAHTAGNGKIMFVGNGASAAISSHMSTDFWKNGKIRAIAFNDSSGLTCIGNDYGYKHVFEKPIEMFANPGDILIAISSSGKSENILLAAHAARKIDCKIITLSGFAENNPLTSLGDINFYVPANEYGPVEILHHSICHCILDTMVKADHG